MFCFQYNDIYDNDFDEDSHRCRCFDQLTQACDNISTASEEEARKPGKFLQTRPIPKIVQNISFQSVIT